MTFDDALAYLRGLIDETRSARGVRGLDRMRALLDALGDPHLAYPTVHVGGTSGKGSTCALIAEALRARGLRTGLHVKPHLRSETERACIDGVPVAPERFASLLEEMLPAIERVTVRHGAPSYYETLLALTFLHFAREAVEIAVIEVGVGGRLDGTNVVHPQVAAITSVGLDHTEILGDTLQEIAFEKAGIAKTGVPLVCGVRDEAPRAVIARRCEVVGAPFVDALTYARIEPAADGCDRCTIATPCDRYTFVPAIPAAFQRANAALAACVLEHLPDGLRPGRTAIEDGFGRARLPGRMEVRCGSPPVVFDIAHNAEKAAALVRSLHDVLGDRRAHLVLAVGASKDAHGIIAALRPIAASWSFTAFATEGRSSRPAGELVRIAADLGIVGDAFARARDAFERARERAMRDGGAVVVTGSTFVVAELYDAC